MPYVSQAQRGYMHVHHPDIAARWDKEYPNQGKLPKHVRAKNHKAAARRVRKKHARGATD